MLDDLLIFMEMSFKCCVAAASRPDFISVLLYFSGPSGSMTPIYLVLRVEYHPGSAIFILYFGLVALEGSTFHQNFRKIMGHGNFSQAF